MSKININFNNTNYSIDESSLTPATAELKSHLSTVMNGTGATINLGGTTYNVDSAKLSAATSDFVNHLGKIAGNGHKVTVNGVEYGIDSTKLTSAISDIEAVLAGTGEERLEGDGAEFYTLAPTALSFRSTAPLNELQEIQINGVTVDPSNYTLEEGSTIVTFPIDYLKTLNVGSYEVAVASDSKTVKGGFNVKAPELNEYGFYYNQPYAAYLELDGFSSDCVVFAREDGTADFSFLANGHIETATWTYSGNIMTINSSMGITTNVCSADGMEFYCNELNVTFGLSNASVVADNDYIYIYKEDLGGYEVNAIDKTKAEYGAIKTGINGISTVKMADYMFYENTNLVAAPEIPNTVTTISEYMFDGCANLTNVLIPKHITTIYAFAFADCASLKTVTFEYGSKLTHIGNGAFMHSALEAINIPEGVKTLGGDAFRDCINLKNVSIPTSITHIYNSFINCTSLVYNQYDNAYYLGNDDNPYLVLITSINKDINSCQINARTNVVANNAFSVCNELHTITFEGNSQLTYINSKAFSTCGKLDTINYSGTVEQWNAIAKPQDWIWHCSATVTVQCSDGQVAL